MLKSLNILYKRIGLKYAISIKQILFNNQMISRRSFYIIKIYVQNFKYKKLSSK